MQLIRRPLLSGRQIDIDGIWSRGRRRERVIFGLERSPKIWRCVDVREGTISRGAIVACTVYKRNECESWLLSTSFQLSMATYANNSSP